MSGFCCTYSFRSKSTPDDGKSDLVRYTWGRIVWIVFFKMVIFVLIDDRIDLLRVCRFNSDGKMTVSLVRLLHTTLPHDPFKLTPEIRLFNKNIVHFYIINYCGLNTDNIKILFSFFRSKNRRQVQHHKFFIIFRLCLFKNEKLPLRKLSYEIDLFIFYVWKKTYQ